MNAQISPGNKSFPENKSECFEGYKVIDADTHLSEPHDLWLKNATAKYKERVPQVKMVNGRMSWVIDGDKCIGAGASPVSTITKEGTRPPGFGFMNWTIDDCHPASWRVKDRLQVMDEYGVSAQIVYPNILGFGGQMVALVDPELRLISVKLFNDAMAQLQEESGQRLFPMALLPWWDINESVKEAKRAAEMGLRGININSDPHSVLNPGGNASLQSFNVNSDLKRLSDIEGKKIPDLGELAWYPLWEVCEGLDLPVNFHIGASLQSLDWFGAQAWPSMDMEHHAALGGAMLFFNNGRVMANLICSGILERFPKLKFVSVESGVGWIPFLLEALDHQYREMVTKPKLKRLPSEYFRTNFYSCFWFERRDISALIKNVGVDNVLFETDFPHPTCLYPVDRVTKALGGLTSSEITKVLSGNASRIYNIAV
jgi:predicted TIM-barrel fold metal-dependent hydrolase